MRAQAGNESHHLLDADAPLFVAHEFATFLRKGLTRDDR
jgi:hypothetical protein